jgi:hypothetical protein
MHGVLMRHTDALAGCIEGPEEEDDNADCVNILPIPGSIVATVYGFQALSRNLVIDHPPALRILGIGA